LELKSTRVALAPASRLQYAALPFRRRKADDRIEVTLLTSRDTGRWVIPKGWPIRGTKPKTSAAREALEEAGLVGRMTEDPIGTYYYYKRLSNGIKIR
jgi:8-oxo-dGTP pyrophosphatase MutT (NUDIX family)